MLVATGMHTNNFYSSSYVQGLCFFLSTDFCLQVDDAEEITRFSLETPASSLSCIADSTGKYSL